VPSAASATSERYVKLSRVNDSLREPIHVDGVCRHRPRSRTGGDAALADEPPYREVVVS